MVAKTEMMVARKITEIGRTKMMVILERKVESRIQIKTSKIINLQYQNPSLRQPGTNLGWSGSDFELSDSDSMIARSENKTVRIRN